MTVQTSRDERLGAVAALLVVAVCWGVAYAVVKDVLPSVPVTDFLAWRFAVAAAVLAALRPGALRRLGAVGWAHGCLAATPLAAGYLLQTVGLRTTSAAVSGFLTGLLVVMTPLLAAWLLHEHVPRALQVAVGVSTIGLAALSLDGVAMGTGEALTVVGALMFALHVLTLARLAARHDAVALTAVQLTAVAAVCLVLAAPGGVHVPADAAVWQAILVTALPATALAYLLQTWAQRRVSATTTAIVLTGEPVFAATAAVVLGGEVLGPRVLLGGSLVVGAMLLAVLGHRPRAPVAPEPLSVRPAGVVPPPGQPTSATGWAPLL